LRAIGLIIDNNARKTLEIDDFNKYITLEELKKGAPKIRISLTINSSKDEESGSDDLCMVADWLTKLEKDYQALLTYEFFLPEKENLKYLDKLKNASDTASAWEIINTEFLRLYSFRIWGGNVLNRTRAEGEFLRKFDYQFLDAIRDVERDLFSGKNILLKTVLNFFLDYELNSETDETIKKEKTDKRKGLFSKKSKELISDLSKRLTTGKEIILKYAKETGATTNFNNAKPNFQGNLSEIDVLTLFKLILEYEGNIKIPATHNGLGYNNLIFISLLLSKMQIDSDSKYLSDNAKVFPVLAIEEPEAHLHPSMQFQFLNFLKKNIEEKKVRQIFITTHSTHIVSSTPLDELICLYDDAGKINVSYLGKAFQENVKSKNYVERFLDATKSDMLFAQKVIFVEGIAEQLLISTFAKYLGISLEERHVSIINVNGRYFDHFLHLFNTENGVGIKRKVACITDIDPARKMEGESNPKKCFPYEMDKAEQEYEYSYNPFVQEKDSDNVRIFTQDKKYGRTFEYDLIRANPTLKLLISDTMSNSDKLKSLMDKYKENPEFDIETEIACFNKTDKRGQICEAIKSSDWSGQEKAKALIATYYLNSVGKGENAFELAYELEENWKKKGTDKYEEFHVPGYIKDAIEWIYNE
jgi:predicted ATP-dependent endonuclease of OLD family